MSAWLRHHPWKATLIALAIVFEVVALLATRGIT